jgi:Fe-S-cluster containining protein
VTRAEEVDAQLEAIYQRIPDVHCRGLCQDACGPITGGHRELVRMRRAGATLLPVLDQVEALATTGYTCPALVDGQCSTYAVRPAICRAWGAVEDLRCPFGCHPADGQLLTAAEAHALIEAATNAGTPLASTIFTNRKDT